MDHLDYRSHLFRCTKFDFFDVVHFENVLSVIKASLYPDEDRYNLTQFIICLLNEYQKNRKNLAEISKYEQKLTVQLTHKCQK